MNAYVISQHSTANNGDYARRDVYVKGDRCIDTRTIRRLSEQKADIYKHNAGDGKYHRKPKEDGSFAEKFEGTVEEIITVEYDTLLTEPAPEGVPKQLGVAEIKSVARSLPGAENTFTVELKDETDRYQKGGVSQDRNVSPATYLSENIPPDDKLYSAIVNPVMNRVGSSEAAPAVASVVGAVIIFVVLTLYSLRGSILFAFSPQHTVDPDTIAEEIDPYIDWGIFNNQYVNVPRQLAQNLYQPSDTSILGEETASNKRIEIDLTNQRLYAYEGDRQVMNYLVSTGLWGRTPNGTFNVWTKLRATKMSGGSKALRTYYYLPNVPYVMYFYGGGIAKSRGYGIHGTYWHSNFGHPMSHGCINMRTSEAEQLFNWAYVGIPVVIYGTTPRS